jgi:hypothetical protein
MSDQDLDHTSRPCRFRLKSLFLGSAVCSIVLGLWLCFQPQVNRYVLVHALGDSPDFGYLKWERSYRAACGQERHVLFFEARPLEGSWASKIRNLKNVVIANSDYQVIAVHEINDQTAYCSATIDSSGLVPSLHLTTSPNLDHERTDTYSLADDRITLLAKGESERVRAWPNR